MLSIIVAMDKNNLIGDNNAIPWHLPADLAYFKKITTGKSVIMGRKTFDSIFKMLGKPLPNRENIILTRDKNLKINGCKVIHTLAEIKQFDNAFIIGGSNIYNQTLDLVDKLYITFVDGDFYGDAYFPKFEKNNWKIISEEKNLSTDKNKYSHTFTIMQKKL